MANRTSDFLGNHTTPASPSNPKAREECPICLEDYIDEEPLQITGKGSCTHVFGKRCLATLLVAGRSFSEVRCPMCRTTWIEGAPPVELADEHRFADFLGRAYGNNDRELSNSRAELIRRRLLGIERPSAEREALVLPVSSSSVEDDDLRFAFGRFPTAASLGNRATPPLHPFRETSPRLPVRRQARQPIHLGREGEREGEVTADSVAASRRDLEDVLSGVRRFPPIYNGPRLRVHPRSIHREAEEHVDELQSRREQQRRSQNHDQSLFGGAGRTNPGAEDVENNTHDDWRPPNAQEPMFWRLLRGQDADSRHSPRATRPSFNDFQHQLVSYSNTGSMTPLMQAPRRSWTSGVGNPTLVHPFVQPPLNTQAQPAAIDPIRFDTEDTAPVPVVEDAHTIARMNQLNARENELSEREARLNEREQYLDAREQDLDAWEMLPQLRENDLDVN